MTFSQNSRNLVFYQAGSAPREITTRDRTAESIVGENIWNDSSGYFYRSICWLDRLDKNSTYPTLLYACIEARMGVEYLLFEELILNTGAKLSREDYERCLKDRNKISKLIKQLSPDLEKAQAFTRVVTELHTNPPDLP